MTVETKRRLDPHCRPPPEEIAAKAARLGPWFHNLHLPGGVETAPDHPHGDFPAWKWAQIAPHLPRDLGGRRALDIGCNAGFYAFELAARGAEVVALDTDRRYLRQARWAARHLDPHGRVRFREGQVHDLARAEERFDLVLFMGVFYHLRYPLLALDTVAALRPRLMVFQTLTCGSDRESPSVGAPAGFDNRRVLDEADWPRMAFVEGAFEEDPTNWWVPNHAAILGMLRSAGFAVTARPGHEIYLCTPAASGFAAAGAAPTERLSEWRAATGSGGGAEEDASGERPRRKRV